jgi:hypothetical protein
MEQGLPLEVLHFLLSVLFAADVQFVSFNIWDRYSRPYTA